jgi:hypothetical protein
MKTEPEKKLEGELIEAFAKQNWFAHHFDVRGLDGWYDIIAIKGADLRLIECKAGSPIRQEQVAFATYMQETYNVIAYYVEKTPKGLFRCYEGIDNYIAKDGQGFNDIWSVVKWITL